MNVTVIYTKDYENKTLSGSGKNKANTKPNKANFRKAKMNVNFYSTKDYENISNCSLAENKPNTNPIQTQTKPISKAKKCCCVLKLPGKMIKDEWLLFPWDLLGCVFPGIFGAEFG